MRTFAKAGPSPRVLRRLRLALLATAVVAPAVLTGCSSSNAGSGSTPTVTVWSWRSQDKPVWQTVQDDLAKKGVDVNIDFRAINPTSYDAVLRTAMNGGSGPDIFYDRGGEGTQTYGAAGFAKPLDGIIDKSSFTATTLATAQYKNKTYGVPFAIQTMSVLYNKDLLAKYHLGVPKTWNQWLQEMKTIKSKGIAPLYFMGVQQWMLALQINAVGASTMSDDFTQSLTDRKATYTDQPYVQTLSAFRQLAPYLEDNWQSTGSQGNEQQTEFALGKAAFDIDGIFDTAAIRQVNPNMHLGQFLVPSPNGGTSKIDWYPDGNISMNAHIKDSAVEKAAAKVVAFSATKPFGDAFSGVAGEISPIKGVQIPAKYGVARQAAQLYHATAISPLFGIRSPMDTPNPDPSSLTKKSSPTSTPGIFDAEQKIAVPLLEGKITPQQAAQQVQNAEKWYFKGAK